MALTKIGSIGINTGIQFAGVTTIATLNASDNVLSVGGTVNFTSDVSIGGSVSIGGTLTYEDVTNIDSVGLITARDGIEVTDKGVQVGTGATVDSASANILTFLTNGSERARIESGGNIGIGTDNPNNLLHVYGGQIKAQTSTDDTNTDVDLIRAQCGSGGNALFSIRAADAADDNSDWDIKTNANEDLSFTIGGSSEKLRITNDGYFLVGATASRNVGGRTASLQIQGITGTGSALSITRNSANSNGPHVDFAKSRVGSLTDNTVPQDGDALGEITFSGADGTDTVSMGVRIRATLDESNGAVGVNSMPGKLSFQTSSAGNQNPTERLSINSAGISTFYNDLTIDTTALATTADLTIRGGEGSQAQINLIADDGDDNGDSWRISAMAGFSNRLIFHNRASGSYTDVVSFQTNGTIRPGTTNQSDLGSSDYRWANVYTNDLNLSNKGSTNNVDGTWGDYTIQEGETDLYLINNRSGKKYKFNLTEVS